MNEIGCKSFHLTKPSGKIYSKVIGPIGLGLVEVIINCNTISMIEENEYIVMLNTNNPKFVITMRVGSKRDYYNYIDDFMRTGHFMNETLNLSQVEIARYIDIGVIEYKNKKK